MLINPCSVIILCSASYAITCSNSICIYSPLALLYQCQSFIMDSELVLRVALLPSRNFDADYYWVNTCYSIVSPRCYGATSWKFEGMLLRLVITASTINVKYMLMMLRVGTNILACNGHISDL